MARWGIAKFVPAMSNVNAWHVSEAEERSSWQEQEDGTSVPHLTTQPCEPPSLSLSWPAAKPAIPMLTGLAGNTKRLITVWKKWSVHYNTSLRDT